MKKRLISLLLVGVMTASMAACGGSNGGAVDSTESTGTTSTASTGTYDTLVVGVQSLEGVFSHFSTTVHMIPRPESILYSQLSQIKSGRRSCR